MYKQGINGRIPFLVMPNDDGTAYLLRDVLIHQWTISVDSHVENVTSYGDVPSVVFANTRTISGSIGFVSDQIEMITNGAFPGQLEIYSVSDMLKAINHKLRERAK